MSVYSEHAEVASHPRDMVEAGEEASGQVLDLNTDEKSFGLRMIDTPEGRNSASVLINKMYSWRGYSGTHKLTDDPNRITLTATDKGQICGTLTLGIDSSIGILADEIFKEEIDGHRARGAKVCEITKLAFDSHVQSKEALASIFHVAFMYARDIYHCTDMFIEVNPRHRRFYQHMLGFKLMGEPKNNPRVDAPAYLLWLPMAHATEQIQKLGGTGAAGGNERSFYPLFFSPREEKGILNRLLALA